MKSPMVEAADYIDDKECYSEMQVLRSAAGYYVGTTYTEDGFEEPGTRDSPGYFETEEQAASYLEAIERDGAPVRLLPDE